MQYYDVNGAYFIPDLNEQINQEDNLSVVRHLYLLASEFAAKTIDINQQPCNLGYN